MEEDQPFGDVDADWTLIDEEGDLQEAEVQASAMVGSTVGSTAGSRQGRGEVRGQERE